MTTSKFSVDNQCSALYKAFQTFLNKSEIDLSRSFYFRKFSFFYLSCAFRTPAQMIFRRIFYFSLWIFYKILHK